MVPPRQRQRIVLALAASVAFVRPALGQAPVWEEIHRQAGIVVERRDAPDDSNAVLFRGQGLDQAPLARVAAVVYDVDRHCTWQPACRESRALRWNGPLELHAYYRIRSRWLLVDDRDTVVEATMRYDGTSGDITFGFRNVEGRGVQPDDGVVRMPLMVGRWVLSPSSDGLSTHVVYEMQADPGGWIPRWVSAYVAKFIPLDSISGLRERVHHSSVAPIASKLSRILGVPTLPTAGPTPL